MNLRIPGPTPLTADVAAAMTAPIIDHRGAEFSILLRRVTATFQRLYETSGDVYLMTNSGWGGVESMIVNTLNIGDRALAVTAGFFGEKFADIARVFGVEVDLLQFPDGAIIDPDALAARLREAPGYKAVLLTHNESYTGVLHPLEAIARAVRENSDALILVDAVSALGGLPTEFDAWGIDALSSASQKALMGPPGMATLAASARAWAAYTQAKTPRFYLDWGLYRESLKVGHTPHTPALPVLYALAAAAKKIDAEGLPAVYARHARVAAFTRARVRALGLALMPEPNGYSPTLTVVCMPEGVNGDEVRAAAREMGVEFGGSWGRLQGKIIRIGHMGMTTEADIDDAVEVLGEALARVRGPKNAPT
ncbi:MAG: alanine--glyoxylate aminotransferase family protein [Thermoflexales bacterium]